MFEGHTDNLTQLYKTTLESAVADPMGFIDAYVRERPRVEDGPVTKERMLSAAPVTSQAEYKAIDARVQSNSASEEDKWRRHVELY